jgi:NADH:ubiquinone oxidoreductase subunit
VSSGAGHPSKKFFAHTRINLVGALWTASRDHPAALSDLERVRAFYIHPAIRNLGTPMKQWLLMLFVWWRGATWGTLLATMLYGHLVGTDAFGNRYYQNKSGTRRWVLYNGTVEASRVPPEWHGWLHFTFREPPTVAPLKPQFFEKQYLPNLSGTAMAYRPEGSLAARGERAPTTADYEAWSPE